VNYGLVPLDEIDADAAPFPVEPPGAYDPPRAPQDERQTQAAPIIATPFSWPDCATIAPRQWLYGKHLIRGFVSVTVAPSGVGKSTLVMAESLAMVSGRALLHGVAPAGALNVWIWNGEDPIDELNRRIAATAMYYGIRREKCPGNLFVNSGRDTQIIVAETVKFGAVIARPVIDAIKATIKANKIDVLIIDPFVSSHRVSENDNNAIDAVAREWAGVANATKCAIELVHHSRKTSGAEVTIEDARGASALISAARSARVLNAMTPDDAAKAGVEHHRQYFRVDNGKSSMAAPNDKATWFHLQSVELGNGERFGEGDHVGVATEWKLPNPLDQVSVADLRAVQAIIAEGQWRENVQAKGWAGHAVAQALKLDTGNKRDKAKIIGLLRIWKASGALVEVEGKDVKGMARPFIEVGVPAND
jgi:hypothetical protein